MERKSKSIKTNERSSKFSCFEINFPLLNSYLFFTNIKTTNTNIKIRTMNIKKNESEFMKPIHRLSNNLFILGFCVIETMLSLQNISIYVVYIKKIKKNVRWKLVHKYASSFSNRKFSGQLLDIISPNLNRS